MTDATITAAFEGLLDPISAKDPTGPSIRFSPSYAEVREARREDDASLPVGVWERPQRSANWDKIVMRTRTILMRESKDLMIACWLSDAVIRSGGLRAVPTALAFLRDFQDAFWDTLHPQDDGDEDSPRFSPLTWFDKVASQHIRTAQLVEHWDDQGTVAWSWSDHDLSAKRAHAPPTKNTGRGRAPERHTPEAFTAAIAATPTAALQGIVDTVHSILAEAEQMHESLSEKAGSRAPVLGQVVSAAHDIEALIFPPLSARSDYATEPAAPDPDPDVRKDPIVSIPDDLPSENTTPPRAWTDSRALTTSREEAYATLRSVSDFLRETEPHSTAPYLIDRAVRWGGMSLQEIMLEIEQTNPGNNILGWILSEQQNEP